MRRDFRKNLERNLNKTPNEKQIGFLASNCRNIFRKCEIKDGIHLPNFSIKKLSSTFKLTIQHTQFIHAIILFLCAYILRLIPEFMVGKYPIGNDTITFYAPYLAKFRFDLLNMFYWGHLISWLFLKFNYIVARSNPYLALKIVGPELYGFLIVSFYNFLLSLKWSNKRSFLISLILLVQVPALRLSWDLFHNVLGLSFMFFALSELSKISRSKETDKKTYVWFAVFSILTALTHQLTTFILFSVTFFLVLENLFKEDSRISVKKLIISLAPAFFIIVLTIVLPKCVYNNANPFQISYRELMMEQAGTQFFVNYLNFMSYSELLGRISLTFVVAYTPLIPLIVIGYKHEKLAPLFQYYAIIILLCTFSPLATGISLFHWDRWMWLLIFPFSVYVHKGITVISNKISKLKLRDSVRKLIKVAFISIVMFCFLSISFMYVTRPLSDPFIFYDNFPSKLYLPETMQKTAISFEYISDLENCVRWLDDNVKARSVILFETPFSGFVLLNLTPRSNVTLISYYYTEFSGALEESLAHKYDYIYFIWWTNLPIPKNSHDLSFLKIYTSGSLSVYMRPIDFKPLYVAANTGLIKFKNGTYIQVADNGKLSPSTFTIEFWAKPTGFNKWARWMGKSLFTFDQKEGWEVMWTDDPASFHMFMAMWDKNGVEKRSQSIAVSLNEWTHIVFAFNGTHILSYGNGNLDGIIETGEWKPLFSEEPLRIGKAYDNSYYDGFFASFRFYNRTLSSFDIAHNILGEITRDGLLLEYDFVDRNSTIMPDLSGESLNGTIITH
jgi:hypothetical protein